MHFLVLFNDHVLVHITEGSLNTRIQFLLRETKLEGAVQVPTGVRLIRPTLTWLKEDIPARMEGPQQQLLYRSALTGCNTC